MVTTGACAICEYKGTPKSMRTHILKHFEMDAAKPKARRAYLVTITDRQPVTYWMFARVSERATLLDLDDLIRDKWVECCGHLSAFSSGGMSYDSTLIKDGSGRSAKAMEKARASKVLRENRTLGYVYDFGTSTDLTVKLVAQCSAAGMKDSVEVAARNQDIRHECGTCGKAAAEWICTECIWGDDSPLFCTKCGKDHEHGSPLDDDAMYLPVVNSPRMGVCGYTG